MIFVFVNCVKSYNDSISDIKGLMEDTNNGGSNDTSINHHGLNAPYYYWKYGLNVCFDVLIHTFAWGHEMNWKIKGYETNTSCEANRVYETGYTYSQRCCLPTREHVFNLTCIDTFGDGWNSGANIEIEGQHYCQNFKGDQMTAIVPNPARQQCENGKSTKMYLSFVL